MHYMIAAVIGYAFGSVPVATLVARRHGVDLYRTGDGNPGAWNALEQLGRRRAGPAFVGDGAKALVACLISGLLGGWWVSWAAVAGAMAGHALPLFARGRGGKAVMCFAGGAIALSPMAGALALVLCGVLTRARSFATGARAGVFAYPVIELATDPITHVEGTGILMSFIGVLFLLRRRPARATDAPGAPLTG